MDPIALAIKLLDLAVSLVGKDMARQLIDRQTVETADHLADALELAKFGETSHKE